MEHVVELVHEGSAGRDGVVFEIFLAVRDIGVAVELVDELLVLLRASEPPGSLVVHLAAWSHAVERHHDHLGGFEHVDERVDIVEDFDPDLLEFFGHELGLEDDGVVLSGGVCTLTHL